MNKNQDTELHDKLLRELMLKMPPEKAPESFTSGVMQQVYSGFEPVQETPELRRQMLFGYISLLAAIVIVGVMVFAQWPFLNINLFSNTDQLRSLLNASLGILDGFNSITQFLKDSSTIIIIMSSIGLLLLFERFLRRGFQHNRSFLL